MQSLHAFSIDGLLSGGGLMESYTRGGLILAVAACFGPLFIGIADGAAYILTEFPTADASVINDKGGDRRHTASSPDASTVDHPFYWRPDVREQHNWNTYGIALLAGANGNARCPVSMSLTDRW